MDRVEWPIVKMEGVFIIEFSKGLSLNQGAAVTANWKSLAR